MSTGEVESYSSREGSPGSFPSTGNSEEGESSENETCRDSGVVLNTNSYRIAAANPVEHNGSVHPSAFNFRLRGGPVSNGSNNGHPSPGMPLSDLRRPSIIEMVNSGGVVINQGAPCEIKLENVLAHDVEMMYAYHGNQRRGSQQVSELAESSWMHSSVGGSSQHVGAKPPSKFSCPSLAKGWWNTKFNSVILEKHLNKTVVEFLRRRFRLAVLFIGLFSLLWIVFFSVNIPFNPVLPVSSQETEVRNNFLAVYSVQYSLWYVVGAVIVFVCVGVLLFITFTKYYGKLALPLSILLALLLMLSSFALALALYFDSDVQGFLTMSFVSQFTITAIIILIVFTLSRMPIALSFIFCIVYLVILELLVGFLSYRNYSPSYPIEIYVKSLISRILFYACLVLTGLSTSYLLQIRQHATFWKIAQCVLTQKAVELERELEEQTILSMMPKPFADELMTIQVQLAFMVKQKVGLEEEVSQDPMYQSISTPFTIRSMKEVSILFADIVDFTEFSSTLSAAELVGVLNNVFLTFDDLVYTHNCEKISTLGDCYFCVSGCPEPASDHADNCAEMGLAIVEALSNLRKRTGLPINMRVGVHTGEVFCGVMGTKRFKFDVWSKDVRIAKSIESVSTPGRVLISSCTRSFFTRSHDIEIARSTPRVPELDNQQLYYMVGYNNTDPPTPTISIAEWKKNHEIIDLHVEELNGPESPFPTLNYFPPYHQEPSTTTLCCPWNKKRSTAPVQRPLAYSHSSTSIVDIITKQKQLQKCTSYAELAVPQQDIKENSMIVELMEEQRVNFDTYFDPQLKIISLQFHDRDWEATYRNYGRDLDDGSNGEMTETEIGYRITKLSYMIDTAVLFACYILIMVGSAVCLSSDNTLLDLWPAWLGIFLFGLIVELVILVHVLAIFAPNLFPSRFANYSTFVINWYVRSLVALFMIYYPMTVVCVSISQCQSTGIDSVAGLAHVQMTFFVTIVVLISSISFMEVSHIVKFVGGFLSGLLSIVMVVAVHLELCIRMIPPVNETFTDVTEATSTVMDDSTARVLSTESPKTYLTNYYTRHVAPEAAILLLLLLILLAIVNRMSEVSVRLSFIARIEASARRRCTRQRKAQAEWLLYNIIPPHVVHKLRKTGNYSQDHNCVGVIFASIVNFRQFQLDTKQSDEESLRLLNVIISEFDALLDQPRFSNIEKIKTIGSTYMAASGLDLPTDKPCNPQHLVELIEFAQQLIEVLEHINCQGFVFRMRIGFNYGPVTSGVVGSQKMLYDIWGDTVNVASRMDSTGLVNRIHMPETCLRLLAPYVAHEAHKVVNVKGKGEMRTLFVTRKYQQL